MVKQTKKIIELTYFATYLIYFVIIDKKGEIQCVPEKNSDWIDFLSVQEKKSYFALTQSQNSAEVRHELNILACSLYISK